MSLRNVVETFPALNLLVHTPRFIDIGILLEFYGLRMLVTLVFEVK